MIDDLKSEVSRLRQALILILTCKTCKGTGIERPPFTPFINECGCRKEAKILMGIKDE